MRKHLFYHFRPPSLASKIDQIIMFFLSRFLDLLVSKMVDVGNPFKIRGGQKWQPKSTNWRQKVENVTCWYGFVGCLFQTQFSRNHSNPCAVGTSWLLTGHFFDVHWLIVCFRCVSLCFVLYNIFITFFKKHPSRWAIRFLRKSQHIKNIIIFLIFVFAFAFFLLFHISVDFRVPLADALGQIGIIFDRCWWHCWFNVSAFSAARAELLQRLRKKFRKKLAANLQRTSR